MTLWICGYLMIISIWSYTLFLGGSVFIVKDSCGWLMGVLHYLYAHLNIVFVTCAFTLKLTNYATALMLTIMRVYPSFSLSFVLFSR